MADAITNEINAKRGGTEISHAAQAAIAQEIGRVPWLGKDSADGQLARPGRRRMT